MKSSANSLVFALLLGFPAQAKPVETDTEAVDAFRAIWRQTLGKQLEARPFIQGLKQNVFEEGKVTAKAGTSTEALKRLNSTLTEKEEKQFVLFGQKGDLESDREVWIITHPGGPQFGFEAILDPKDGDLLFFWIIPEG